MSLDAISQFAFDLGKVMGATSNHDGEVCAYLRSKGIYTAEIEAFYQTARQLAEAFYVADGDKLP
jgi:hypothetical protein